MPEITTDNEVDAVRSINSRKKAKKAGSDEVTVEDKGAIASSIPPAGIRIAIGGSDNDLPAADGEEIVLNPETLRGLVSAGVQQEMRGVRQELDVAAAQLRNTQADFEEFKRKADAERQDLQTKLDAERRQKDTLGKVFSEFGYAVPPGNGDASAIPYIAPLSMRGGINGADAVKEYCRILNDASATPKSMVVNPATGEESLQQDLRRSTRFLKANRDALREGMEALARKHGLLRGQSSYAGSDAATTESSIPFAFLTYLSAVMRIEHSAQFVLWQFPNRTINANVPPGQTVLVPRVQLLTTGSSSADWQLTPGTDINVSNLQPLQGSGLPVEILENGMGNVVAPVSIPDFVMAYSLIDLESVMSARIGYNYHQFEDISIFEMLSTTTAVVYNNKGNVVSSGASVVAGGGGQLTNAYLGNLRAYMSGLLIPSFPDGKYVYIGPPNHIAQLNSDLAGRYLYMDRTSVEDLTNMLAQMTANSDLGRINGYQGTIGGFHIFEGNSFSVGAPGTPGVQTETVGTVSVTTRSAFAMGLAATGWATSMPMEIRMDPSTNFGRNRKFIWKSHEGFAPLDVDPNSTSPANTQQLRVLEVRMSDSPV